MPVGIYKSFVFIITKTNNILGFALRCRPVQRCVTCWIARHIIGRIATKYYKRVNPTIIQTIGQIIQTATTFRQIWDFVKINSLADIAKQNINFVRQLVCFQWLTMSSYNERFATICQ